MLGPYALAGASLGLHPGRTTFPGQRARSVSKGYDVTANESSSRTFSKHLPGDVLIVQLERVSDKEVRVILIGAPH